jgi:cholesterol oxidase
MSWVPRRQFLKLAAALGLVTAAPPTSADPRHDDSARPRPDQGPSAPAPALTRSTDYDVVVVGSGFGGAPVAARLAQAGYKVAVLERGRRWDPKDYPRRPGDAWIWSDRDPVRKHGWLDLRVFPHMSVALGSAVGGGSLIYTNASRNAPPDVFDQGWPPEITYASLQPYYDEVAAVLRPVTLPESQEVVKTRVVREAARGAGYLDRLAKVPLAVQFDPSYSYDGETPPRIADSKPFVNEYGHRQGTCVGLGNCYVGCDVQAKNTLDVNYIPLAEKHGADVRALHIVRRIHELGGSGYRVSYDRIASGRLEPGSLSARIVVLSAGSLGSTELLLRSRDEFRGLPRVGARLGSKWSGNGEFLPIALFERRPAFAFRGPTITSAVDFSGPRSLGGAHFMLEDGGFPDLLRSLADDARRGARSWSTRHLLEALQPGAGDRVPLDNLLPWFSQSRDAADGRLALRRRFLGLLGPRDLHLHWDSTASARTIDALIQAAGTLTKAAGGELLPSPFWDVSRDLITAHALGGCPLGTSASDGVVDHRGEVFGHRNLFVADGAVIPRAIGLFPSKTIAALGERTAQIIIDERR